MTLNEFLYRLSRTPRDWALRPDGKIRSSKGYTPLDAVHVSIVGGITFADGPAPDGVGIWIGLSREDSDEIRAASDGERAGTLRPRLLVSCGIFFPCPRCSEPKRTEIYAGRAYCLQCGHTWRRDGQPD